MSMQHNAGQYDKFRLRSTLLEPNTQYKWTDYMRGVIKFIQERCPNFTQGADLVITGNVPLSAGLSSFQHLRSCNR